MSDALSTAAAASLELYFEAPKNRYWQPLGKGFAEVTETNALRRLQAIGLDGSKPKTGGLSEAEAELLKIQSERYVSFVGSLPGYRQGLQHVNRKPVLITDGPQLIEPREGDWSIIMEFVETLLGDPDHDQINRFLCWLRESVADLYARRLSSHLALVLVGPADCGKTQLKDQVIVPALGGRQAQPFSFLQGKTDFNADLFDAEVLVVDDETSSAEWRAREALKARIKILTATGQHRHHPKFGKAIVVETFWRVVMACNDDGNNLLVLPQMESSIRDKVLILKCSRAAVFDGVTEPEDKAALRARIAAEMPAFLHWLLNEYRAPVDLPRGRLGVVGWQHPDPIQKMYDLSAEAQLDEIITTLLFPASGARQTWKGMEGKLAAELYADAAASRQLNIIIGRGASSLRGMLHALAEHQPDRYAAKRQGPGIVWTIAAPAEETDES